MPTNTDLLSIIEKEQSLDIKQLAKKLGIQVKHLEKTIKDLNDLNLVEYNQETGKIKLLSWLIDAETKIENTKPAIGTIILPKNGEIRLQDAVIGNFTDDDLELNVRLTGRAKEIAICKLG